MKLAYNIVSAAGENFANVNFNTALGRHIAQHNGVVLNVPIAARNTLLAERLRTGTAFGPKDKMPPMVAKKVTPTTAFQRAKETLVGELIGVEIEYYPKPGTRVYPRTNLTRVVSDGSLNFGGYEINKVTWQSASGRLEGLLNLKLDGKVDKTCGLHVHVDARHLGKNGLLTVEETYKKLVRLARRHLKRLCPASRRNNRYCRFKSNLDGSSRYCAVNFMSYAEHGTLEFRMQAGSTNLAKIEAWALLCQHVLNWCAKPENKVPSAWPKFIQSLPPRLQGWAILREAKLNSQAFGGDDLSASATQGD